MERGTFLSHKLLDHEMRYSMVDKECLAIGRPLSHCDTTY